MSLQDCNKSAKWLQTFLKEKGIESEYSKMFVSTLTSPVMEMYLNMQNSLGQLRNKRSRQNLASHQFIITKKGDIVVNKGSYEGIDKIELSNSFYEKTETNEIHNMSNIEQTITEKKKTKPDLESKSKEKKNIKNDNSNNIELTIPIKKQTCTNQIKVCRPYVTNGDTNKIIDGQFREYIGINNIIKSRNDSFMILKTKDPTFYATLSKHFNGELTNVLFVELDKKHHIDLSTCTSFTKFQKMFNLYGILIKRQKNVITSKSCFGSYFISKIDQNIAQRYNVNIGYQLIAINRNFLSPITNFEEFFKENFDGEKYRFIFYNPSDDGDVTINIPIPSEYAEIEVIDLVVDKSGLGFGIYDAQKSNIIIKTIVSGGLTHRDGRIKSGDNILQIGEFSVQGTNCAQVATLLRHAGNNVHLIIGREASEFDYKDFNGNKDLKCVIESKNIWEEVDKLHIEWKEFHEGLNRIHLTNDNKIIIEPDVALDDTIEKVSKSFNSDTIINNEENCVKIVVILHKKDGGLGIKVSGYRTCQGNKFVPGVFISRVTQNSSAQKHGNVLVGDQIIEVNGKSLLNVENEKAFETLKNAGEVVLLCLKRPISAHKSYYLKNNGEMTEKDKMFILEKWRKRLSTENVEIFLVQLFKENQETLGLVLEGTTKPTKGSQVHLIRQIVPDGLVSRSAVPLVIGDSLLEVNGTILTKYGHLQVVAILKSLSNSITFVVSRHKEKESIIQRYYQNDKSLNSDVVSDENNANDKFLDAYEKSDKFTNGHGNVNDSNDDINVSNILENKILNQNDSDSSKSSIENFLPTALYRNVFLILGEKELSITFNDDADQHKNGYLIDEIMINWINEGKLEFARSDNAKPEIGDYLVAVNGENLCDVERMTVKSIILRSNLNRSVILTFIPKNDFQFHIQENIKIQEKHGKSPKQYVDTADVTQRCLSEEEMLRSRNEEIKKKLLVLFNGKLPSDLNWSSPFQVTIPLFDNSTLGLSVVGCGKSGSNTFDCEGYYIKSINYGGLAYKTNMISVRDKLEKINSIPTSQLTHKDLVEIIKNSTHEIILTLSRKEDNKKK
ncbi:hypothetical protein A3Q56_07227 [Intoshia linei]|uniref:PDZ domain-containing protein n=1 Tax=Intoshia linei TaxID=1819745 RepID=A0A177ASP2_9BILA|nr:hypothetical protein A3Q56_07227 [Intoshia linei]